MLHTVVLIKLFFFPAQANVNVNSIFFPENNVDTVSKNLVQFKVFAGKFIQAIEKNDSNFLGSHVIFPVNNSNFLYVDSTITKKKIDRVYFFKHLHSLFPHEMLNKIKKNGIFAETTPNIRFCIKLYEKQDNLDLTTTLPFKKEGDKFYFDNLTFESY